MALELDLRRGRAGPNGNLCKLDDVQDPVRCDSYLNVGGHRQEGLKKGYGVVTSLGHHFVPSASCHNTCYATCAGHTNCRCVPYGAGRPSRRIRVSWWAAMCTPLIRGDYDRHIVVVVSIPGIYTPARRCYHSRTAPSRMMAPIANGMLREVEEGTKKRHVCETTCRRQMLRGYDLDGCEQGP
jgi:hypothetical protein